MILVLAMLAATSGGDPVATLHEAVQRAPDDLDTRLRLALALSWQGERTAARTHALEIVAAAPTYLDAQLLLARLDTWDQRFEEARTRLRRILIANPGHPVASEMLVDIAIRTANFERAGELSRTLLSKHRTPELFMRLASAELGRGDHVAARSAAAEVLARAPDHEHALRLTEDVPLVRADAWSQVSFLPYGEVGLSETISVRALPRHFFSFVLTDEIRRRFGFTDNRLELRGDWRATRRITLSALGGFGAPSRIVARWLAGAAVSLELAQRADSTVSYRFEALPIGATLHRARADIGVVLLGPLRAELTGTLGILDYESGTEPVRALGGNLVFVTTDVTLRARYGFGNEVDLLLDPSNPAFVNPEAFLVRLSAHSVGAEGSWRLHRHLGALVGYELQLRSDDQTAHHLRARLSFYY